MSQEERFGTRDRTYSAWHRRMSTRRFVGIEKAQTLAMIDLDAALYVEYDDSTKEPIALVETARDCGQTYKCAAVTRNLAKRAGIEAFVVLYTPSRTQNPADSEWPDISEFRVMQLHPVASDWKTLSPATWARCLVNIRQRGAAMVDAEIDGGAHV